MVGTIIKHHYLTDQVGGVFRDVHSGQPLTCSTDASAKAAGNNNIHIKGQSAGDVLIKVLMNGKEAEINLDVCLIIKDLGTDVLIGQPAKIDHHIVTMPHLQKVTFKDTNGIEHTCKTVPRSKGIPAEVLRTESKVVLFPGESFKYRIPPKFEKKHVVLSPRKLLQEAGFAPKVLKVDREGCIELHNTNDEVLVWPKCSLGYSIIAKKFLKPCLTQIPL